MPRLVWTLPLKLRPKLARPLDKVYSAQEFEKLISRVNPRRLVTVGDIVTASVIQKGIVPKIGIIDGKTKRERTDINLPFNLKKAKTWNPAGSISLDAIFTLRLLIFKKSPYILFIEGEEDLLTIPALILCPNGYTVCYGQPDMGVVCIKVNKNKRGLALSIFRQMEARLYE